jgi:hypothetical protein
MQLKPVSILIDAACTMSFCLTADWEDRFIVGMTYNPPDTMSPLNFVKCGQWSGASPPGQALFVQCADNLPPMRYVVIVGNNPNGYLNVCELEVYGKGMTIRSIIRSL